VYFNVCIIIIIIIEGKKIYTMGHLLHLSTPDRRLGGSG